MLTKDDKKELAELIGAVVGGVVERLRNDPPPMPIQTNDPRHELQVLRRGGPAHDVREIRGILLLTDSGSAPGFSPTNRVIGKVPAALRCDFTKSAEGRIIEIEYPLELPIKFYGDEFTKLQASAYEASKNSPEHLAHLEKERVAAVGGCLWHRLRAYIANVIVGRDLDDPEVAAIFRADAAPIATAAE